MTGPRADRGAQESSKPSPPPSGEGDPRTRVEGALCGGVTSCGWETRFSSAGASRARLAPPPPFGGPPPPEGEEREFSRPDTLNAAAYPESNPNKSTTSHFYTPIFPPPPNRRPYLSSPRRGGGRPAGDRTGGGGGRAGCGPARRRGARRVVRKGDSSSGAAPSRGRAGGHARDARDDRARRGLKSPARSGRVAFPPARRRPLFGSGLKPRAPRAFVQTIARSIRVSSKR